MHTEILANQVDQAGKEGLTRLFAVLGKLYPGYTLEQLEAAAEFAQVGSKLKEGEKYEGQTPDFDSDKELKRHRTLTQVERVKQKAVAMHAATISLASFIEEFAAHLRDGDAAACYEAITQVVEEAKDIRKTVRKWQSTKGRQSCPASCPDMCPSHKQLLLVESK